jgi:tetratricopeptide (TPR) repeat protein
MASRLLVASLLVSSLAFSGFALAQPAAKPDAAKPDAKAGAAKAGTAAVPAAPAGPLKDPANKMGISPYMEIVAKGEASFVARDFPGAVSQFQEAVKLDGQKMLAFYRLGEAQLAAGKPEEAEAVWTAALSKDGTPDLKAKVHFVLADLRERQRKLDTSKEAWGMYGTFVKSNADAKGYAGTPEERTKVIDRRVKDEKDYAAVKERIIKRQAEREKEAAENAKKDKANR